MKISLKTLKKAGACGEQLALFKSIFGNKSVEITEGLCLEHSNDFAFNWAAATFLSPKAYAEYNHETNIAAAEYHHEANKAASICTSITDAAKTTCRSAMDEAEAKYNRERARIFGRLASKS